MRDNKTYIYLTGGLGNQLFQLAAGLSRESGYMSTITLDWKLGASRQNSTGLPEIHSFDFGEIDITYLDKKVESRIIRGIYSQAIKFGSKSKRNSLVSFYLLFLTIFLSAISSIRLKKLTRVFIARGIGYSPVPRSRFNLYLIGYFQSYRYLEVPKVREFMGKMSLKGPSFSIKNNFPEKVKSGLINPIVVHVRLTDYLIETKFGIPDSHYYQKAIQALTKSGKFNEIWLFSDDPDRAESSITGITDLPIKIFNPSEFNTAESFMLMRLGKGYVLANSTFGWWAASLALEGAAKIYCPQPWFIGMEDPYLLIPVGWRKLQWV